MKSRREVVKDGAAEYLALAFAYRPRPSRRQIHRGNHANDQT